MTSDTLFVGDTAIKRSSGQVSGAYVALGDETFYCIANYDRMPPFFMSLVSASNHWLFISSTGGLTAGRRNANNALFPYYTEDKIRDNADSTGAKTLLRVSKGKRRYLWEPFSARGDSLYDRSRNLYKNVPGSKLVFEEVNRDLELVFRHSWAFSDRFGVIKRSELINTSGESVAVEVLDGLQNILPWGIEASFQNEYSCLGDAYKDNALDPATGLATYAFSSIPGDSPEPAEALRATVCWSTFSASATRLLSSLQLEEFRHGGEVTAEARLCGRRGAYFVQDTIELASGASDDWLFIADLEYGLCEIAELRQVFADTADLKQVILDDIEDGTRRLEAIVARADGLQKTGDGLGSAHHFANVMFNVMRGGLFESSYAIDVADLLEHLQGFNRECCARHREFLTGLGERVERQQLLAETRRSGDAQLLRLVSEYLPISFSRRHGDPSRPWNQFSINVKNRDGSKILDYQGNWRDIFQNWEALCLSFPGYIEGVIGRFLNTTTADGYNPYRVTRDGYDWEAPEPDEPWSHFGYWGDHQLIYLLKFLEWSDRYHPGELAGMLADRRFVFADVPYDIKPYHDLLDDPRDSIVYNAERAERIAARVEAVGYDGQYLTDAEGSLCHANLAEKLLVPLLAKMSNFVPGGGFWMNTQRPEWNDANNALAGYGVSMVTLYYARRYVTFLIDLLDGVPEETLVLGEEAAQWLEGINSVLIEHRSLLESNAIDDRQRKAFLDGVGQVAEVYRAGLYREGLSGRSHTVAVDSLTTFLRWVLRYVDQTIALNRRSDGLYHAYNVLVIDDDGIAIERLNAMLEGQVAVLSSGALRGEACLSVLRALRQSEMYRADQHSYLLYPDRVLPAFTEKNTLPPEQVQRSALLQSLVQDGNVELVEADVDGQLHFNGLFRNIRDIHATLERLREQGYGDLVDSEHTVISEIFESVFEHRKFTGRSGTFYGYEGLGCIYWHMVSKLLLATQESALAASADSDDAFAELVTAYYDVRAGIGFNKTPDVYGAFPTDPYSHTPGYAGARQPGMTGQVKEEIITRLGELGVVVQDGRISFHPVLLRADEFLAEAATFDYYDVTGRARSLELDAQTLVFTYCQVPVVYRIAEPAGVLLHLADGTTDTVAGLILGQETSRELFQRTGRIQRIDASLPRELVGA